VSTFHLIDLRASSLVPVFESEGKPSDVFLTPALAARLGVSRQWLEMGRCKGYGPPSIKIGSCKGYRRDAVIAWLRERASVWAVSHPGEPSRPECVTVIRA